MPRYDLLVTVVMAGPYAPTIHPRPESTATGEDEAPAARRPRAFGGARPVVAGLAVAGVALGTAEVLHLLHLAA